MNLCFVYIYEQEYGKNTLLVYFQGFRGPNGTLGAIGKPGPMVGQQNMGIFLPAF